MNISPKGNLSREICTDAPLPQLSRDFDWSSSWDGSCVLGGLSVLEIYSATRHTKFANFETKQMLLTLPAMAGMFILAKIDYHRLLDWAPWAYAVFVVSLVAVKAVGHKALGARRWIGDEADSVLQPSEWVKLVLILTVARYFANLGGRDLTWRDIFKAFGLVGIPMVLVLIQPDLGTTLTYAPILVAGLFLGGINLRQAAILTLCGLTLIVGVWTSGKILKLLIKRQRLTSFINPDNDPAAAVTRFASRSLQWVPGGVGKGDGERKPDAGLLSSHPLYGFHLAAFSEEHGFVGRSLVLLLYFFILMRLIQNAQTAADLSGSLIIMGIVAVLTFQIAVNVGMVIGFMPVTGIPLPLMSYGGSSVLFSFLALGVAMNVRMRRFVN